MFPVLTDLILVRIMKVRVKEVYPIFAWSWDTYTGSTDLYNNDPLHNECPNKINNETYTFLKNYRNDIDDVCGICRVSYNGVCPNCKMPGKSCPLVVGTCNHNFHYHCIYRWLDTVNSKGLCPMCRQEFILKPDVVINAKHTQKFMELISKNRERRLMMEREERELNDDLNMEEEDGVSRDAMGTDAVATEAGARLSQGISDEEDDMTYDDPIE
mgnify:CR=1 FL=1